MTQKCFHDSFSVDKLGIQILTQGCQRCQTNVSVCRRKRFWH